MDTRSRSAERRVLQASVAVFALIPILAGLAGVLCGLEAFDRAAGLSATGDSHVRYLSGLILAIGLGFWSTVPRIEAQGSRFRLLAALVIVGGAARLYALARFGPPAAGMLAGLGMELLVTPALAIWRETLERRTRPAATSCTDRA
jgi:hypothetical protein